MLLINGTIFHVNLDIMEPCVSNANFDVALTIPEGVELVGFNLAYGGFESLIWSLQHVKKGIHYKGVITLRITDQTKLPSSIGYRITSNNTSACIHNTNNSYRIEGTPTEVLDAYINGLEHYSLGTDGHTLFIQNKEGNPISSIQLPENPISAEEVRVLYESISGRRPFTTALYTKLLGVQALATIDQTGTEISELYEGLSDRNRFSDTYKTKLDNLKEGADGYMIYTDTAYTTGSELALAADTPVVLTNNRGTIINSYKPNDITDFLNASNIILGVDNDLYGLSVTFKAKPTNAATEYLEVWVDVGTTTGEKYKAIYTFPKGQNVEREVIYKPVLRVNSDFATNGAQLYVSANNTVDIYDIEFLFTRLYKAS